MPQSFWLLCGECALDGQEAAVGGEQLGEYCSNTQTGCWRAWLESLTGVMEKSRQS